MQGRGETKRADLGTPVLGAYSRAPERHPAGVDAAASSVTGGATFVSQPSLGVVGESARSQTSEETLGFVEQIARGDAAAKLRAQVAQWHPEATLDQIEDAFQEACLLAVGRARGRSEGEVFTWIRTTTTHKVSEIVEATNRVQPVGQTAVELVELRGEPVEGPEAELLKRENRAELEWFLGALLERLSERQREVMALHTRGRNRPQIAACLGITKRTVKRELERVVTAGRAELTRFAGHGCDGGEELVRRFAFGLASQRELSRAQFHLATCPRCAAFFERLDAWHQRAAALLPLPAVQQLDPGLAEHIVHGATKAGSAVKQQLAGAGTHIKQHAASTYYRAVDPTPLAGVRPGAAAATVAGCLAIGGGATYCVQQDVDPIGGLSAVITPAHHEHHSKPHKKPTHASQAPAPQAVVTPPVQPPTTTAPPQQPTQTTPPVTTQPEPPPAPQDEYEPSSAGAGSTETHTSSSTASEPAAAPTNGPGEFGGP